MKFTTLILNGFIILTQASYCLSQSHYGTEFVFGIPHNYQCEEISVTIAAYSTGTYNFTVPILSIAESGTIQSNLKEIKLNCSIAKVGTFTDSRGLYLKTSTEVAVYVTTYFNDSAESFLVIPVPETGKQYSTAAYQPASSNERSFVLVAASNPETHVSIYNDTSGRFVKNSSLNPLEVLQLSTSDALHGIRVIADKQVAVITGTTCANIPLSVSACDIITEQMIPTQSLDRIYIAPPTPPKEAYELRVTKDNSVSEQICFHNRTRTYCGNESTISIRMGNEPTVILSDNPVSVVQFGYGNFYPLINVGDPFMTVIPGLGNFMNNYFFAIPTVYRNALNHLSIILPTKYIKGLVLDGVKLNISHNDTLIVPKPLDNYTVVILTVNSGYHHLYHCENSVKFGLLIYGFGTTSDKFVGFGYPGGMRLSGFDNSTTLSTSISATSLPYCNVTYEELNSTNATESNTSTSTNTSTPALPHIITTDAGLNSTKSIENNHSVVTQSTTSYALSTSLSPTTDLQTNTSELYGNSTSLQDPKNKTENNHSAVTQLTTPTSKYNITFAENTTSQVSHTTSYGLSTSPSFNSNVTITMSVSTPFGFDATTNSQTNKTELNGNLTSLQDTKNKTGKSSLGIILGAVIGAVFAILLLACLFFFLAKKRGKPAVEPENTENTES